MKYLDRKQNTQNNESLKKHVIHQRRHQVINNILKISTFRPTGQNTTNFKARFSVISQRTVKNEKRIMAIKSASHSKKDWSDETINNSEQPERKGIDSLSENDDLSLCKAT